MTPSVNDVSALVAEQLNAIRDPLVREGLSRLVVTPERHMLGWDYGEPGEQYPCWTVAVHPTFDTWLVYSEQGFGPQLPWGMVSSSRLRSGMDSSWYPNLRDCFLESWMSAELPIWQVVQRGEGDEALLLRANMTFDDAYDICDALRESGDGAKYDVLPRGDDAAV
jgi:hypothetical protein